MRFLFCCLLLPWSILASGQPAPESAETYTILRIDIEGVDDAETRDYLARASGLRIGQTVTLPADPAFAVAIRSIYRLEQFEDVSILHKKGNEQTVFVTIRVTPVPVLSEIRFTGIGKKDERALRHRIPLAPNAPLRSDVLEKTRRAVLDYYSEKGFLQAAVRVSQERQAEQRSGVVIDVDTGPRIAVTAVRINGLEQVSERALRKRLATTAGGGLKFWEKKRFNEAAWRTDLEQAVAYLHEKGFYDARVLHDTVYVETIDGTPGLVAEMTLYEGRPYFVRHIVWEGNTRFSDEQLSHWLGIEPGDRYNRKRLDERLFGAPDGTDISARYQNDGYMRVQVQPTLVVVGKDSLDLFFDVTEGDRYDFGRIEIAGNTTTRDHVVRRELLSIPGETFSRQAIQESVRRLMQTGYFGTSSLSKGPGITIDDEKKNVDLTYTVEETAVPKPQLTGTFGPFGLVLGVGFTYNNFSLRNAFRRGGWRPLPSGDGQSLGMNVQANGKAFQQFGFNFTEPWFRGKPAPIGIALSYTHIGSDAVSSALDGRFNTFSARFFHERRLKWPDPFFQIGTSLAYESFDNTLYDELPAGANRKLALTQSISRNTTDHPVFPTRGSKTGLSVELALPVGDFIRYHKWRLESSWNFPLARRGRLSFNASGDFGYIGAIGGRPVDFERFVLGGSPLDAQGVATTPILGTDVVYFRGYPLGAFGRDAAGRITGGRVLNKYSAELRWSAVRKSFLQATPYLFFDMANTWNGLDEYRPFDLFRSAGAGIRMNIPVLGLVEIVYGRNLDAFGPDDTPAWGLQFSIGRSFNF